jgi:hypothetical protein
MAPKISPDALPKAALEFKKMLEDLGGVTPANIKGGDSKLRNKAILAMKSHIASESAEEYKQLHNDSDRHDFIAEYLMDPQKYSATAKNFVGRTSTTTNASVWVWLTLAELGGARWLNSPENAAIAVTTMKSRPHSTNTALQLAGVLEYRHHIRREMLENAISEGARIDSEAPIASADVDAMSAHMRNSNNPGEDAPRTKKARKKETIVITDIESAEKISHKALYNSWVNM